jgi:hypothetical protein
VHCGAGSGDAYDRIDRLSLDTFKAAATNGKVKRVVFTSGMMRFLQTTLLSIREAASENELGYCEPG